MASGLKPGGLYLHWESTQGCRSGCRKRIMVTGSPCQIPRLKDGATCVDYLKSNRRESGTRHFCRVPFCMANESQKPALYLAGSEHGTPTLEDLVALARALTGREPTPEEIESSRKNAMKVLPVIHIFLALTIAVKVLPVAHARDSSYTNKISVFVRLQSCTPNTKVSEYEESPSHSYPDSCRHRQRKRKAQSPSWLAGWPRHRSGSVLEYR